MDFIVGLMQEDAQHYEMADLILADDLLGKRIELRLKDLYERITLNKDKLQCVFCCLLGASVCLAVLFECGLFLFSREATDMEWVQQPAAERPVPVPEVRRLLPNGDIERPHLSLLGARFQPEDGRGAVWPRVLALLF